MDQLDKYLSHSLAGSSVQQSLLDSLIDWGIAGFFPLISSHDMNTYRSQVKNIETSLDKMKALKNVEKCLQLCRNHKSLERKKVIIENLEEKKKIVFISSLFYLIEVKTLEQNSHFH